MDLTPFSPRIFIALTRSTEPLPARNTFTPRLTSCFSFFSSASSEQKTQVGASSVVLTKVNSRGIRNLLSATDDSCSSHQIPLYSSAPQSLVAGFRPCRGFIPTLRFISTTKQPNFTAYYFCDCISHWC